MEQDNHKLIYFQLKKSDSAKNHIFSPLHIPCFNINLEESQTLLFYQIPEFYCGSQAWQTEKLRNIMQKELDESGEADYYMHPWISRKLEITERFPPEILLKKTIKQNPCWEYLFIIGYSKEECSEGEYKRNVWNTEEEFRNEILWLLIEEYLPRINHITIVTDLPELYEAWKDYVYREYGTPVAYSAQLAAQVVLQLESGLKKKHKKTVVLDVRHSYKIPWTAIPEDACYIDCWSETEKQYILEMKRRDVRYLSVVKFLDTLVKNGYNTLVN